MATEESIPSGDLRGHAVEYQRDNDKKHKWAFGQTFGPGQREEEGHPRPARLWRMSGPLNSGETTGVRRDGVAVATFKAQSRKAVQGDIQDHLSSDCSTDDDVEEPTAAPAPDSEITYSFDAFRGPSHGSQILGHALDKAMERFEVRATDKLIKDEYEVLDNDGESVGDRASVSGRKAAKTSPVSNEDEDFELI